MFGVNVMRKVYKLQGIGGSIYVALPKEWLRRYGLDRGSMVEMFIDVDGYLKILPIFESVKSSGVKRVDEIEISVDKLEDVYTSLLSAYLRGFDLITLRFSGGVLEREVKEAIDSAKDLLLGLEAIDVGGNYVVLKILASEDVDAGSLVKNMHKMVRSMYLDAFSSLELKDIELAKAVVLRDRDVNKLYFYVTRVLRKKILTGPLEPKELLKLMDLRMLIKFVESVGDEAKKAALASIEIVSKGLGVDRVYVAKVKEVVDRIDEIYRDVVMRGYEKTIDVAELRQHMKICLLAGETLKHMKVKLVEENPKLYRFAEFIEAYESIAMNIYDILSLTPFELISAMIYE